MLRLFGFLVITALTAGGYMYFDYRMSAKWSGREDAEGLTFTEYLSGLSGRLSGLGGAAAANGLPTQLADMLPQPPEGWTVRPTEPADIEGFLPKSSKRADRTAVDTITRMGSAEAGSGSEVVVSTYEKGDRKVIIKATRYPNVIFTSFAAMQQRMELRMTSAQFRGTEFATVRGLDVTEDLLPEGFRGRLFLADVGAQIHLRILAPKRMSDEDLVAFLQTLHVKAMNASVIDKVEGLGDVPVIVLASALGKVERDAYLADLASREAEAAAKDAKDLAAAESVAAEAAEDGSSGGFLGGLFGGGEAEAATEAEAEATPAKAGKIDCTTDKGGVKRCTVEGAQPAE